jgi:NADH dehydrogenase
MLHEVAASDLEMNTIVNPLRKLLRQVKTFTGNIESINLERRCVAVTHGFDRHVHELPYDHLIIALGSSTNFFGLPGVQDIALTIKTLEDAVELRNRLITYLEEANSECAAGQRQPLLTFVVVGAGFAGVEMLGGINDFVREAIRFYPNLTPEFVRTILVSSDKFILPELGSKLGAYAQRKLAARGVEIIMRRASHLRTRRYRRAFKWADDPRHHADPGSRQCAESSGRSSADSEKRRTYPRR